MSGSTRRVTMFDVARASDVSYQTVSRVINDAPNVAPATRARVLDAIRDLGYQPSKAARSLAGGASHTLALVTFGMGYYGPAQMMLHIERAARAAGYDLIFANVDHLDADLSAALASFRRWPVDGILAIAPVAAADHERLLAAAGPIPLIQLDADPAAAVPAVSVDQYTGGLLAAQHLLALGHRAVACIDGPADWFGARARGRAWRDALTLVASQSGDWTAAGGYAAAEALLASADFSALLVGNDQMALGAMRALRAAGRRIPQDVAVVGFDNIPEAAYFDPPLTTVHQDFEGLAARGVADLIAWIGAPDAMPEHALIPPRLIVRASTGEQTA